MNEKMPANWTETANEWRYRLREPKRFTRIRPRKFRGVEGVYAVGGPLRRYDSEYKRHEPGAWVPQALRFKKERWTLEAAVKWERESYAGRRENPRHTAARRVTYSAKEIGAFRAKWPTSGLATRAISLDFHENGDLWRTRPKNALRDAYGSGAADALISDARALLVRRGMIKGVAHKKNPDSERRPILGGKYELERLETFTGKHTGAVEQYIAHGRRGAKYGGLVWADGKFHWISARRPGGTVPAELAGASPSWLWREAGREAGERIESKEERANPMVHHCQQPDRHESRLKCGYPLPCPHHPNPPDHPATERASSAAMRAVELMVRRQGELDRALVPVREKLQRGEMPDAPEVNALEQAKLELEEASAGVRRAVSAHAGVIEEFHVPASRRVNPPRGAEAAADLYREFHGAEPSSITRRRIPDTTKLAKLGTALEVHYRPAVPRGARNTPYRHAFGAGAELYATPKGDALVILGPFTVGRAPRGKLGYIRG